MILAPLIPELMTMAVLASSSLPVSSSSAPALACPAVASPAIEVVAYRNKAEINHLKSREELETMQVDTQRPHQMMDMAHVKTGGVLHSDIHIDYEVGFDVVPASADGADGVNGVNGRDCVRYGTIRIVFTLNPEIYIASDYAADSCWYREIYEHEQSHIDMDENVILKYADFVQEGMKMAFSTPQDYISGPVDQSETDGLKQAMGADIVAMVSILTSGMAVERLEKQQAVDSLGGYAHIMNSCYNGPNVVTVIPDQRR